MVASESKYQQIEKEEVISELEETQFEWTKQWYPIAVIKYLDPTRPIARQLLGEDVVIWRDGQNKWRCFQDACPHRSVPLSEGRIESDGNLLCSYHAWRFNGEGKCVKIPQSQNPQAEIKNCANPLSCAKTYPVIEALGLLWVWPSLDPEAQQESQLRNPRLIEELEDKSDNVIQLFWYEREVPFGWDFFMENVMDATHVPVSHHKLYGDRYKDAKYCEMLPIRKVSTQEGFSFSITPIQADVKLAIQDFQPPCFHRIELTYDNNSKLILALFASPTRPGWCRLFTCQVLVKNSRGQKPPGFSILAWPIPDWLGHVFSSFFVHQDLVFLHKQEKIMAKRLGKKWAEQVFTPNSQDRMLITFRKWFEQKAGGSIPWATGCDPSLPPMERNKQKLFDIYSTHTQDCQSCQKALKNINRLKIVFYLNSFLCLFLAILLDSRNTAFVTVEKPNSIWDSLFLVPPPMSFWLLTGGSIILALIALSLKKLSKLFYIYEFEHYQND